jgi:LuxR family maltose regulon positive regulatory protein
VGACRGAALSWTGALDESAKVLSDALESCVLAGLPDLRLEVLGHLALCEAWRGRLRRAEALSTQLVDLAGDRPAPGPRTAADVALSWVALERDDLLTALRHADAAAVKGQPDDPTLRAGLALVRSALQRPHGDTDAVAPLQAAREPGLRPPLPAWLEHQLVLAEARTLTAAGAPHQALALLDGGHEPDSPESTLTRATVLLATGDRDTAARLATAVASTPGARGPLVVRACLVLAAREAGQGRGAAAREMLDRARRLAAPEAVRRPFGEVEPSLRALVREATGDGAAPDDVVIVEPLSRRELEVLQHVAAMLSNEEIADVLFVSVNTVRTHVRSILRKLSASRRSEAVRRARERNLI